MITLIRHARSTFNESGDQSRDCPISETGKLQAGQLSGQYDIAICSTLKRARQTLDYSEILFADVQFNPLCREVLDGNPINLYPLEANTKENQEQVTDRVNQFRNLLRTLQSKYQRIVVISHSVFLYRLTGHLFKNAESFQYTP